MNFTTAKYFSASVVAFLITIGWAVIAAVCNVSFPVFLLVLFAIDAGLAYFVIKVLTRMYPPPNDM